LLFPNAPKILFTDAWEGFWFRVYEPRPTPQQPAAPSVGPLLGVHRNERSRTALLGVETGLLNKQRQLFDFLEALGVRDFEAQVHVVVVAKLNGLSLSVVY
jgi:hypothetical protein